MRILDKNNNVLENPDLNFGYLIPDKLFIQHHEAIKEVLEQGHYEIIAEYPNGGKDIEWIIDIPAVKPQEAWDEYEDIKRYIEYTPEELEEKEAANKEPTPEERLAALEEEMAKLIAIIESNPAVIPVY